MKYGLITYTFSTFMNYSFYTFPFHGENELVVFVIICQNQNSIKIFVIVTYIFIQRYSKETLTRLDVG